MTRITTRGFVRVMCCLYLPPDETIEMNTVGRQRDNDWTKTVSVARIIPELGPVIESRPAIPKLIPAIRCGPTATRGRYPSPDIAAPAETVPRPSNNNQEDASTQTDFDNYLGQNSSQASRHRTSIPTILRVGRAVLSGSGTDKRRVAQCSQVREEHTAAGQVDLRESQRDDAGERQDATTGLHRPGENAVGKWKEAANQYIAYHRGN
ncbi:hypothetical protein V498_03076 [Pseudogymnoascus sp. VKM F-4517 (FW-2822)]|nr:hypothetical protein V498_03076 [Pseudogymnoascus sp. VKM F-4517 (FW-2822)]